MYAALINNCVIYVIQVCIAGSCRQVNKGYDHVNHEHTRVISGSLESEICCRQVFHLEHAKLSALQKLTCQ